MDDDRSGSRQRSVRTGYFDFLERNQVKTQIRLLLGEGEDFGDLNQEGKIAALGKLIRNIAEILGVAEGALCYHIKKGTIKKKY